MLVRSANNPEVSQDFQWNFLPFIKNCFKKCWRSFLGNKIASIIAFYGIKASYSILHKELSTKKFLAPSSLLILAFLLFWTWSKLLLLHAKSPSFENLTIRNPCLLQTANVITRNIQKNFIELLMLGCI